MPTPNDDLIRTRALDIKTSFMIQAPAGSGKTELLVQRILALLTLVDSPEEILAMTFTRKAALEMRTRVFAALEQGLDQQPETPYAQKTWALAQAVLQKNQACRWDLLENPSRLNIQTIDSLCQSIRSKGPVSIGRGYELPGTDFPDLSYQNACESLFQDMSQNTPQTSPWIQALQRLLLHFDHRFEALQTTLIRMLKSREQWLPLIYDLKSGRLTREDLENTLQWRRETWLSQLKEQMPTTLYTALLGVFTEAQSNLQNPSQNLDALQQWQALAHWLLTDKNEWRKRFTLRQGIPAGSDLKAHLQPLLEALLQDPDLLTLLQEGKSLPDPHYTDASFEIIMALTEVLPVLSALLQLEMREAGEVDFTEIALQALSLLKEDASVTPRLSHILIDEFQDTSQLQYQIITQLISDWSPFEGKTLFLVGDPMQSIYRFRQADVGLFFKARLEGVGAIRLEFLRLTQNFRSDAQLVHDFNLYFPAHMPHHDDPLNGAVPYHPSLPTQCYPDSEPVVFQEAPEAECAEGILHAIKTWQHQDPQGSIALLVRSRKQLETVLPLLREHQITWIAEDIELLAQQSIILDLTALLRAILHPADDIAWMSVLRAPWCGLSLVDLTLLGAHLPHHTLLEILEDPARVSALSLKAQHQITRLLPLLKKAVSSIRKTHTRACIEGLWLDLDGPHMLTSEHEYHHAQVFFDLLETTDPAWNLEGFEGRLAALKASSYPLNPHTQTPSRQPLHIMTIHKAKGLEFDRVIVLGMGPALARTPQEQPLLLWQSFLVNNTHQLILAPKPAIGQNADTLYEFLSAQKKLQAQYEHQRLTYVAFTRARKALWVVREVRSVVLA